MRSLPPPAYHLIYSYNKKIKEMSKSSYMKVAHSKMAIQPYKYVIERLPNYLCWESWNSPTPLMKFYQFSLYYHILEVFVHVMSKISGRSFGLLNTISNLTQSYNYFSIVRLLVLLSLFYIPTRLCMLDAWSIYCPTVTDVDVIWVKGAQSNFKKKLWTMLKY